MQRREALVFILVAALIVANILGLRSIAQMKSQIAQLQHAVDEHTSRLQGINDLRSDIAKLSQEQELISPIDISVAGWSGDAVSLVAAWQVRDYPLGAKVTFHWKGPQDTGFREIHSEGLGGGRFTAKLDEAVALMPDVIVSWGSGNGSSQQDKAPAKPTPDQAARYTYFVSVASGGSVKSADPESIDLSKMSSVLTHRLSLSFTNAAAAVRASLREVPDGGTPPALRLESASLEGYSGSSKLLDVGFAIVKGSEGSPTPVFEAEIPRPSANITDLWLNLSYSGGHIARVVLAPSSIQY